MEKKIGKLMEDVKTHTDEIENLENNIIPDLKEQIQTVEMRLEQLKETVEDTTNAIPDLEKRMEGLKMDLEKYGGEIKSESENVAELCILIQQLKKDILDQKKEQETMAARVQKIETDKLQIKAEMAKQKKQLEDERREKEELQRKIQEQAKHIQDLTEQTQKATPSPADCDRLHDASGAGDLEEVKRLLSRGVNINRRGGVWSKTPVMMAAEGGHRDVVELLVSEGADVSLVDEHGNNILHFACMRGTLETVEFVLSLNVVDINSRGAGSTTPVMRAAVWRHRDVVELLVRKGVDVSLVDEDGYNILHWACYGGDMETVEFVLSLNVVDIDARNKSGQTVADRARLMGHTRVADLLVSRGAQ